MLSLSRRQGERIKIGDDITLVVLEIRGDQIRLGVEAPREVIVTRAEQRRYTGPLSKFDQQKEAK